MKAEHKELVIWAKYRMTLTGHSTWRNPFGGGIAAQFLLLPNPASSTPFLQVWISSALLNTHPEHQTLCQGLLSGKLKHQHTGLHSLPPLMSHCVVSLGELTWCANINYPLYINLCLLSRSPLWTLGCEYASSSFILPLGWPMNILDSREPRLSSS